MSIYEKISGFADEISQDFDQQLKTVTDLGMKYICIRSAEHKGIADYTPEEVRTVLLPKLRAAGVGVSSLGTAIGKVEVDDEEGFAKQLEQLETLCETAKLLDCSFIRMFSFLIPKDADADSYTDVVLDKLRQFIRIAEKHDIVLLHENEKGMRDIEHRCMTLLLRQQPVAGDLRRISTAMKVVTDVERIGDHASDIAEIIPHLVTVRKEGDPAVSQAIRMGQKAHKMILDALNALTSEDEQAALRVIAADDEVDYDFNAIKHTLAQEIAADPGKVDAALDLLMVIKYLERIGDHAVNLAEWVEFVCSGRYHNENMF